MRWHDVHKTGCCNVNDKWYCETDCVHYILEDRRRQAYILEQRVRHLQDAIRTLESLAGETQKLEELQRQVGLLLRKVGNAAPSEQTDRGQHDAC